MINYLKLTGILHDVFVELHAVRVFKGDVSSAAGIVMMRMQLDF